MRDLVFDSIKVVGGPVATSTLAEVEEAEALLGMKFPIGYRVRHAIWRRRPWGLIHPYLSTKESGRRAAGVAQAC